MLCLWDPLSHDGQNLSNAKNSMLLKMFYNRSKVHNIHFQYINLLLFAFLLRKHDIDVNLFFSTVNLSDSRRYIEKVA